LELKLGLQCSFTGEFRREEPRLYIWFRQDKHMLCYLSYSQAQVGDVEVGSDEL